MKPTTIITVIVIAAVVGIIIYSTTSTGDANYAQRIKDERRDKDEFMRSSEGSPFVSTKKEFKGLQYFDPNPKFRIVADLEPIENKKPVILSTSDGKEQQYVEYAYATFELDEVRCKLLILEVIESGPHRGDLFLAFADQSSAMDTYGAGRYMDLKKVVGASNITLDFNTAYNPYCAYAEEFSCPFPPKENILDVIVSAGEKNYIP